MQIDVCATYAHIGNKDMRAIKDLQAVVIDTLRATTVIVTALAGGARYVVPALDIEEAMQIQRELEPDDRKESLLGGERGSLKIPGFDQSNSPMEYDRVMVYDRIIVLTTSNGTNAVNKMKNARRLLIGAHINASAVANELLKDGGDVLILCSGTRGKFSLDDMLTAGLIVNRLTESVPDAQLTDLAYAAKNLYENQGGDPLELVSHAHHYSVLMDNGWKDDIAFAMREDMVDLVPYYKDGLIVASANWEAIPMF